MIVLGMITYVTIADKLVESKQTDLRKKGGWKVGVLFKRVHS